MSGKPLERNSYWLKGKNNKKTGVKKFILEELNTIDYPSKHEIGLENFSFVEKCGEIAKQKKILENTNKYSKTSKDFSYPSLFRKFFVLCFHKKCLINLIKSINL